MSKINILQLDSVTHNDSAATATINANFQTLKDAIDNTISRDGSVPNFMNANLDMNSYRIINGGIAVDDGDFITKGEFDEKVGNAAEYANQAQASANQAANSALAANQANINAQAAAEDAKEAAENATNSKPLVLENIRLTNWEKTDTYSTYPYSDYTNVLLTTNPSSASGFVVFSNESILSNIFAPFCDISIHEDEHTVRVTLYASENPASVDVPTIMIFLGD